MKSIILAITFLMPGLSQPIAKKYADLIVFEARWYKIKPKLVVSLIDVESKWSRLKKSVTNDYGLMQVHVSKRGSETFYGRESELYDPRTNIREGVRILAMWKHYHETKCKGDHPFWAHYKWGKKVGEISHAVKVQKLLDLLESMFPEEGNLDS
jgi:hypothetical protein